MEFVEVVEMVSMTISWSRATDMGRLVHRANLLVANLLRLRE